VRSYMENGSTKREEIKATLLANNNGPGLENRQRYRHRWLQRELIASPKCRRISMSGRRC